MKDFAPLAKGVEAPLVFVAHPSVPATSMETFAAWAKPQRGKLSYASFSPGTPSHFLGAQLNDAYGLDLGHLPYRGSAPQINDMVAGHAQFGFTQIQSALPHVEAGRLKAFAVTSEKRFRLLPNTPTFAELGKPEFNTAIWFGLLARAATPPDMLVKLTEAARAAHADAKVRETLEPQGFDMSSQWGAEFGRAMQEGSARWARLVQATGFKASE
ncbi:MAG TPA: tripartite tricarboxylate transporter substrate binding protein, partial [Beijerinckiaceae bacterium]